MIHHDEHLTIYQGDWVEVLRTLPDESVHCVVTSPPYWGLRDYGTATWSGGDAECDHTPDKRGSRFATPVSSKQASNFGSGTASQRDCSCGATRVDAQLGLEPTPDAYVAAMVAGFREVRRVLRSDGTLWLNLGDSYANTGGQDRTWATDLERRKKRAGHSDYPTRGMGGLKPKDLVGIPWRLAFALQADGWYLRSDIIWAKPNPMPESVTDRPTKSHEYVFLLTKSARYFYDADAVREAYAPSDAGNGGSRATFRGGYDGKASKRSDDSRNLGRAGERAGSGRNLRDVWPIADGGVLADLLIPPAAYDEGEAAAWMDAIQAAITRLSDDNLRSVWQIATEPYPGAHFATFPQKLVEPCIKAGTSERGVCPECGAPWVREVDRELIVHHEQRRKPDPTGMNAGSAIPTTVGSYATTTTGWRPPCGCTTGHPNVPHPFDPVPATVLDPFAGSGTTGLVANRLGRRAILIDLSTDYLDQALTRNQQKPLGLLA